jgi:dienelactone hydrolase
MKKLLLIAFIVSGILANAQSLPIGHLTLATTDPARNNRNVTAEVYYPGTTAGDDVPVATGSFPLVIFGHGFLMQAAVYNNIWEELVPKGYVCVFLTTEGGISPNHGEMGTDFIFIKNSLQTDASTNTNSVFYQHLTTTSAYMGHSMGGGASYLAAQNDPTVTALVGLAPAVTNPSSIDAAAQINKPAIIFSGAADPVTTPASSHIPIYDSLKSDCKVFVSITGGGHCYFANTGSVCEFGEAGGNFSISREEQQAITNSLLTPWLDYWLKGDALSITMFNQILNSETGITHNETCPLLTTGVKEDVFSAVQVYPNPAKSTIYIKSNNIVTLHYKLINSMGAEVSFGNLTTENGSINTANLSAGIYTIIITQGNQSKSYRIILE